MTHSAFHLTLATNIGYDRKKTPPEVGTSVRNKNHEELSNPELEKKNESALCIDTE